MNDVRHVGPFTVLTAPDPPDEEQIRICFQGKEILKRWRRQGSEKKSRPSKLFDKYGPPRNLPRSNQE